MDRWGSQWAHSAENVSDFVEAQNGVLFLGRSYEGSFWVRGVEMSAGLQLFCGVRAEYKTLDEFSTQPVSGRYSFIVFTKFFEWKFALLKARQNADFLLYDTVDNFQAVPPDADAVLVNTRAQRNFYEYMNLSMPIFVLPHHVGNHNGFSVRGPRPNRAHVLFDSRVPDEAVLDLKERVGKRNVKLNIGSFDYDEKLPHVPNATYARSLHYALQMIMSDVVFRWVGYTHVDSCFKPGHRLANSLSEGVPTVTDGSEGFLEVLDDAGILHSYPFLVKTEAEASALADKLLSSDAAWKKIADTAKAINDVFSLRTISWQLFDVLYALSDGSAHELAAEVAKPVLLDYCSPEQLLEHFKEQRANFWIYEEHPNRTKTKTILVQGKVEPNKTANPVPKLPPAQP